MFDHGFAVDAGRMFVNNFGIIIDDRPEVSAFDLVYWDDRPDKQILCFATCEVCEGEFPQLESDQRIIRRMAPDVRKWLEHNSNVHINDVRFDVIDMLPIKGTNLFTRHHQVTCDVCDEKGGVMFK